MAVIAADCHFHLIDRDYPLAANRNYDPDGSQYGNAERLFSLFEAFGLSHGLVVQAEPYGFDNSCMLDAISMSGGRLKGIALVDPAISDAELDALIDADVVGIRYNLTSFKMTQFLHPATPRLLARLVEAGLFLQIHCERDELVAAMPVIDVDGLKVMIDHFGRPEVTRGTGQPGFQAMLELGRRGNCVVKLSGSFRVSKLMPPYGDVDPYIEAAIEVFTLDNCVWGSDWPFVRTMERIDYAPEIACVKRWLPDADDYRKVMAENPARLFGFS